MGHAGLTELAQQSVGRWSRPGAVDPAVGVEAAGQGGNSVCRDGVRQVGTGVCVIGQKNGNRQGEYRREPALPRTYIQGLVMINHIS